MALINQPFPVPSASPVTDNNGNITRPWLFLLQSLWTRTGEAPGVSSVAVETSANTANATASSAQATANSALSGANASLKKASNLSDLASASTARNNLGLGPIATSATVTGWTAPTGTGARTAINMDFTQSISNPPTQAEVTNVVNQLIAVQKALGQLIIDETTVKTIGP